MSQSFTRGIPVDTDTALTNNSDQLVPSQKAIKAYVDGRTPIPLPVSSGGTGLISIAAGDLVYASALNTLAGLTIGASGKFLKTNGTAPSWQSIVVGDIGSGAALTKVDDTNVTLTLGGTPASALLAATSLTLGWTGTLADGRIASAATWNSKQAGSTNLTSLSGLTYVSASFVKMTAANTFSLDTGSYQPLATNLTSLAGLSYASLSFVKMSAAGTFSLDTTTYLSSVTAHNVLSTTHGDTLADTVVLGDIIHGNATPKWARLAGNTTAVKQYLSQTGTGAVSAAPSWSAIAGSEVTGAALTKVDDTNVTLTLGGTPATSLLRAASLTLGWTGTLAATRGGTGQSTVALGDLLYGSATNVWSKLAGHLNADTRYLSQTGTGIATAAPAWKRITYSEIIGAGLGAVVIGGGLASTLSEVSANNDGYVFTSKGVGNVPIYRQFLGTTNQITITTAALQTTFSTPQDIATTSDVTFNSVTLTPQGSDYTTLGRLWASTTTLGIKAYTTIGKWGLVGMFYNTIASSSTISNPGITETTFSNSTFAIPAGALNYAGIVLRIRGALTHAKPSTGRTITIRVHYGSGETILQQSFTTNTTAGSGLFGFFEYNITTTVTGATGDTRGWGFITIDGMSAFNLQPVVYDNTAIDLTAGQNLYITVQYSATTASDSITLNAVTYEILNAP